MDKKRRRFLIRQKKKRKEKLQKHNGGIKNVTPSRFDFTKLKRADKFVGAEEALYLYFVPADGTLYRLVHDPINENDYKVQSEQEFEGIANTRSDLPFTIAPNSTIEEQYKHLKDWMLSFYLDDEKLAEDMWRYFSRRKTAASQNNFKIKMGFNVAKYNMLPQMGVMQREPDPNSHLVIAEYVNINLDDYRDKSFGLKPLTDYKYGKE